ncbi:MAG: penicillin-binding protein 1C [Calditrichaceae bacterium]|nr:penicillin-binding protein 1C [Calditrichaceae bacterium]
MKNIKSVKKWISLLPIFNLSKIPSFHFQKIFGIFSLVIFMGYFFIPLPQPLFKDDYSTVILDRNNQILRVFINRTEQWHFPPDPELKIPVKLKQAVLVYEDKYFYDHPGINPAAILRALYQNITTGEVISGASTLTMQIARLMNPKDRTYFNKILEIFQALKIEIKYSKEEILKLYLDHAPYGGNIIGYQAAALRYFNVIPNKLTWGQAAMLAVLPNAPGLISPVSNPQILIDKRNALLKNLMQKHIIDQETFKLACREEIPDRSIPLGFSAPHLARHLKMNAKRAAVFRTTIDKKLQDEIENIVAMHGNFLETQGILNASALIVETQTGKVAAYIGSDDFFDDQAKGQVDGVMAPRSSGSILKPFLYALSMDEGYILPQTLIKDVPSYYGAFSPANADMNYRGIVPASQALIQSLNVPAVRLLYQYGYEPFYFFLKEAGVSTLFRHYEDYGLSLILGGAETNLWEMAALYRGLANYGKFEPIHLFTKANTNQKYQKNLISPGASYLTLNVLNELHRPGSEAYWQQYQNQWPLAWKTGTSYGQRDGWAIGVNPQWTIAVWTGNFDGQGNANLSGSGCAGPILFEIFNYLPKDPSLSWFIKPPDDLDKIEICMDTGYLAGSYCTHKIMADAPVHMKPLKICPYHRQIFVNHTEDKQVCSLCWHNIDHHSINKLIYPPDVSQYLRKNGQIVESLPPHLSSCPAMALGNPLQIIYPQERSSLWIPRDFDGALQKINLKAAHQQKDCQVYWYLDDNYKGCSKEIHEMALSLDKGWHELEVIDEAGNRNRVKFYANLRE